MGRRLRHFCPETLYLLSNTVTENQARFEMTPEVRELIEGLLFKHASVYGIRLVNFIFMRHYFKILLKAPRQNIHLFMGTFQSNLSRHLNRLQGRSGVRLFARRFTATPVLEDAQTAVFREMLESPVQEHLVAHPGDWPGVSAWKALTEDTERKLVGAWVDSQEYWLLRRSPEYEGWPPEKVRELATTTYRTTLAKLPVWEELSDEDYAEKIRELGENIATETLKSLSTESEFLDDNHDNKIDDAESANANFMIENPEAVEEVDADSVKSADDSQRSGGESVIDNKSEQTVVKKLPSIEELIACSPEHKCGPWAPVRSRVCITFDEALRETLRNQVHDREADYDRAASKLRRGEMGAYFPPGMIPPGHLYCVGSPDAVRTGQNPVAPTTTDDSEPANEPNDFTASEPEVERAASG